ncbi:MAG: LacI family transcriptional regulator, partial [Spirochaetia bacterium]|nr:LacI family transcriptional regulator [Spirochaetia bacterium]
MPINRDSVAKLAKVSSATVSRVYNSPDKVSAELRAQVLDAAKKLGYLPNSAAATLRRKQTGTIAFVEFKKEDRPYYWGHLNSFDWFFGRAIRGVQQVIGQTSWQLRFHTVKTKQELQVIASQCDGILAYDVDTEEEAAMFDQLQVPAVLAHHRLERTPDHYVVTDNFKGGVL